MKCIATTVQGLCERCSRMNRECLPAIPKPRKRRATDGFESKTIPSSDILEHNAERQAHQTPQRSFMRHANDSPSHHNRQHDESSECRRAFGLALALDDNSTDYLLHGIDHHYLRFCCEQFGHMSTRFPFVEPPYGDPAIMVSTRPVTLVAICTVASGSQPEMRSRLSEAFRHILATRCIMEGEKSKDLMIGLLIYLAWHHQYFKKEQIYQSLCLLAGMATDLGIQRTPSLAEQARGVPEPELERAFIGVYYLITTLSIMGFNKPSPLAWCISIDHFASTLHAASGREAYLQPYIELAHLLEDYSTVLSSTQPLNSPTYIEIASRSSLKRLAALQRAHPSFASTIPLRAAAIYINSKLLPVCSTATVSAVLLHTTNDVKELIDHILLTPSIALHQLPVTDWTSLLLSLLLTTQLSSPSYVSHTAKAAGSGTGWEAKSVAAILQPDATLDRVCVHMESAPNDLHQGARQEGLTRWLRGICEGMKRRTYHEQHDAVASPFDAISVMDRDRALPITAPRYGGLEEGRFRAVNRDETLVCIPRNAPITSSWSPGAATDLGFGSFGGMGLLEESFWTAFSNGTL